MRRTGKHIAIDVVPRATFSENCVASRHRILFYSRFTNPFNGVASSEFADGGNRELSMRYPCRDQMTCILFCRHRERGSHYHMVVSSSRQIHQQCLASMLRSSTHVCQKCMSHCYARLSAAGAAAARSRPDVDRLPPSGSRTQAQATPFAGASM